MLTESQLQQKRAHKQAGRKTRRIGMRQHRGENTRAEVRRLGRVEREKRQAELEYDRKVNKDRMEKARAARSVLGRLKTGLRRIFA